MSYPKDDHVNEFFNLQNGKLMSTMYKINIVNIHLKKKIYIPMLAPILTL